MRLRLVSNATPGTTMKSIFDAGILIEFSNARSGTPNLLFFRDENDSNCTGIIFPSFISATGTATFFPRERHFFIMPRVETSERNEMYVKTVFAFLNAGMENNFLSIALLFCLRCLAEMKFLFFNTNSLMSAFDAG